MKEIEKKKKTFKMPHVYVIMLIFLVIMTLLTYIIPAGTYDFIEVNGKSVVDPSTFHYIEQTPVSFWKMLEAIPAGIVKQAKLVVCTFLIGAAMHVINTTKSLEATIGRLTKKLSNRLYIALPVCMLLFFMLGLKGTAEQVIVFIPLGMMISFSMGADAVAGCAMVLLAMSAGFSLAPLGTSTTATAQTIVGLPLFSGLGYRMICAVVLYVFTVIYIMRYIKKVRNRPELSVVYGDPDVVKHVGEFELPEVTPQRIITTILFFAGIVFIFVKAIFFSLSFYDMCSAFLLIMVAVGIIFKMKVDEIARTFVEGLKSMTFGAILIGLAASISIVMTDGNIIYTCVHALVSLLDGLPLAISAIFMNLINVFLNFFIISGSGQAATIMPIMSPTAQVLGMTQQTAILAYQLGDGFTNMLYPHSGTLMAGLAMARIPWEKWAKFVWKYIAIETLLGWVFIIIAVLTNWCAIYG